jgi:arylsulfatase A-like enzyme
LTPPDVSQSEAASSPASGLPADGIAFSTIRVLLKDEFGNAAPGQTVQVSSTGSGNTIEQPDLTDSNGVATATIASTVAESKTIAVTVNPLGDRFVLELTVEFGPSIKDFVLHTGLAQRNVLLIIADDLGVDRIAAYGEHPDPGNTPVIDGLAQQGILFRNAWSNPVCSTSRATLLTGQYGYRTGIGRGIGPVNDFELSVDQVSLADIIPPTYTKGAVGKWHVMSNPGVDSLLHPLLMGFDSFVGGMNVFPGFISDGYTNFVKNVNGVTHIETNYATTDEVDDAISFIDSAGNDTWFLWLAFHAPHAPFHAPPQSLHSFSLPAQVSDDFPLHVKAMVEAMDTEIGRLLANISPSVLKHTVIIFIGDNGTDQLATTAPFDPAKAKRTIYEGGINVPLIVLGSGVTAGAECAGLVNTTDIFATVAEIVGVPGTTGLDSVSLVPYFAEPDQPSLRPWTYAEVFSKNGWGPYEQMDRAIRDDRFKLLRWHEPSSLSYHESFFDLANDPFELTDLLEGALLPIEQQSYDNLVSVLDQLYEPWKDIGYDLAGSYGPPRLMGTGGLQSGDPATLSLTGAVENALTFLIFAFDSIYVPVKGGVLVPNPSVGSVLMHTTNAQGDIHLASNWPVGYPAGLATFLQCWTVDPGAVDGVSVSNAVRILRGP